MASAEDPKPYSPEPAPTGRRQLSAVPRYFSATLSQGLVSGFHFVLNLLLVKLLSVGDFGIYALTFVIAIMATAIINALFTTPLCVYAPSAATDSQRRSIESTLTTLMFVVLGAALAFGILSVLTNGLGFFDVKTTGVSLLFVVTYLARQYSRNFGYSRFDVITVLFGDILYVVVGGAVLTALLLSDTTLTVVHVLTLLSVGNLLASAVELSRIPHSLSLIRISTALTEYRSIWEQSRWALIGAITTVVVSQAHSIVVSAVKGPAAYAPLAAGFVIFGPIRVIFTTIQNVVKPEMSRAIANLNAANAYRQMLAVSLISACAVIALITSVWVLWPLIESKLYADQYADSPMKTIVMLWAAITLLGAFQNGPYIALQAMKEFKPLAMLTVYGAAISLTLVILLLFYYPIEYTIVGILMTEIYIMVRAIRLVSRQFKTRLAATPVMNPAT